MTEDTTIGDLHNHIYVITEREETLSLESCSIEFVTVECKDVDCDEELYCAETVGNPPSNILEFCDVAYEWYEIARDEETQTGYLQMAALTADLDIREWGFEWSPINRLQLTEELAHEDAKWERERDFEEFIPEIVEIGLFPRLNRKINTE